MWSTYLFQRNFIGIWPNDVISEQALQQMGLWHNNTDPQTGDNFLKAA